MTPSRSGCWFIPSEHLALHFAREGRREHDPRDRVSTHRILARRADHGDARHLARRMSPRPLHDVTFEGAEPGHVRCTICGAQLDMESWARLELCPGPEGAWLPPDPTPEP